MLSKIRQYSKAIAAFLGALTPTIVIVILSLFNVHVDPALAAGICTVAAWLATVIAPANVKPIVPLQAGNEAVK